MNFQTELETLIRARYPILYIISSEEMRVQNVVEEIARKRQKKAFEWSYSTGIVPAGTSIQSQKHRNAATKDPLAALDQVIEQVEPAIFIFKDFHPFLTKNNFAVVRKLKEIALHLKNSFKTIILVSPVMEIPTELEKEMTVLNYPLPSREDLSELLDKIIADVKQFKQVIIDLDDAGRERLLQAALGLTLSEAENVFAKIIVKDERLSGDDVNEVFAEKNAPVFVVATANDISQLPPELLRKGRLDEIFFVDLPSRDERTEVFRIHINKRRRDAAGFDLEALANASRDFSGAEIEEAINSALYDAFYAQGELTTGLVLTALGQTVPLAKTMDEQINRLRTWAEGRARNASVARALTGDAQMRRMEL